MRWRTPLVLLNVASASSRPFLPLSPRSRCPLPPAGQEVQRAELVHADDHSRITSSACLCHRRSRRARAPGSSWPRSRDRSTACRSLSLERRRPPHEEHSQTLVAMSSTTPSRPELSQLGQAPGGKGQAVVQGRDSATFLISWRSGRVNFGGRRRSTSGQESKPSALKLWITSRTRSSEVKAILAMAGTSIPGRTRARSGLFAIARPTPNLVGRSPRSLLPSAPVISRTTHTFCHGQVPRPARQSRGRALPTLPSRH